MSLRFGALVAAVLVLAACDETTRGGGAVEGGGDVATTTTPGTDTTGVDQAGVDGEGLNPFGVFLEGSERVFFAYDSSELDFEARSILDRVAGYLGANPGLRLILEGHCDDRGTREYNLALGERRAQAMRDYLVALGLAGSRLETISYGKERPAMLGTGEAVWAANRRGVILVN